jgi:CheY-like chemotaxis protein
VVSFVTGVLSQETILVVEDEVLIRMPIAQYLRDCGYKVIEAANADEAITVLSHKETVVDVVFTDIDMPGALDGFGLAKWVREHRHGVDVILAGTLPRTVKQAEELCEEGPLPKPYEAQRFTITFGGCSLRERVHLVKPKIGTNRCVEF